jgi:hypothetical protein
MFSVAAVGFGSVELPFLPLFAHVAAREVADLAVSAAFCRRSCRAALRAWVYAGEDCLASTVRGLCGKLPFLPRFVMR